jgi:hypothetical protein
VHEVFGPDELWEALGSGSGADVDNREAAFARLQCDAAAEVAAKVRSLGGYIGLKKWPIKPHLRTISDHRAESKS